MSVTREVVALRSGTTADWASGPVLGVGEMGIDTDKGILKIGDGTTAFASLSAQGGGRTIVGNATLVAGTVTVSGLTGVTAAAEAVASTKTLGTVTTAQAIKATPGTGNLVLTSASGTDTSVVSYVVVID